MRQRNPYGMASTPSARATTVRPEPGPRRPVTQRGRMVLESSRRRLTAR